MWRLALLALLFCAVGVSGCESFGTPSADGDAARRTYPAISNPPSATPNRVVY